MQFGINNGRKQETYMGEETKAEVSNTVSSKYFSLENQSEKDKDSLIFILVFRKCKYARIIFLKFGLSDEMKQVGLIYFCL